MTLPWNEFAQTLRYKNECDMLENWHGTWKELSIKLGVSEANILYRRKIYRMQFGPLGGNQNGPLADKRWLKTAINRGFKSEQEMFTAYAKQGNYRGIARHLGVSDRTIKNRMEKLGIKKVKGND